MRQVVIVGGGITGLAAAFDLQQTARQTGRRLNLTVLEADHRLGGKIQTERRDGFVIETGPDSILRTKPWAVDLAHQLGLEPHMVTVPPRGRNAFVLRRGRLLPIPPGIMRPARHHFKGFLTSPLLSWRGKLRLAGELLLPPRRADGDESLGSFISRRLGREALDYLVEPLLAGIYAGDAHALSLAATFPHFKRMEEEQGGILRAAWAQKSPSAPVPTVNQPPPSPFISFKGGLAALVEHLAAALTEAEIRLKAPVAQILAAPATARSGQPPYEVVLGDGQRLPAHAVIITAPAYAAAAMLAKISPPASEQLEKIQYGSVLTAALGYKNNPLSDGLQGSGYIVPSKEVELLTACTWVSAKWPHSTPAGGLLLRAHLGRANLPPPLEKSDAEIVAGVGEELARVLGIKAPPDWALVTRWPRAMPQYGVGHQQRVARLKAHLASWPGLAVAGAAYEGVGIPDCVRQGQAAAQQVAAQLRQVRKEDAS